MKNHDESIYNILIIQKKEKKKMQGKNINYRQGCV